MNLLPIIVEILQGILKLILAIAPKLASNNIVLEIQKFLAAMSPLNA